jgi:hypothetical protein
MFASLFQNLFATSYGFYLINALIVITLYCWMTEPLPYFFLSSGIIILSFYIRQAIRKAIGI